MPSVWASSSFLRPFKETKPRKRRWMPLRNRSPPSWFALPQFLIHCILHCILHIVSFTGQTGLSKAIRNVGLAKGLAKGFNYRIWVQAVDLDNGKNGCLTSKETTVLGASSMKRVYQRNRRQKVKLKENFSIFFLNMTLLVTGSSS